VTNIFMQVSALFSRSERKLVRTCGVARDQRCGKMTSLPTAGSRDAKIRLVSYRREAYEPKLTRTDPHKTFSSKELSSDFSLQALKRWPTIYHIC
jgi:hypothetical protein